MFLCDKSRGLSLRKRGNPKMRQFLRMVSLKFYLSVQAITPSLEKQGICEEV